LVGQAPNILTIFALILSYTQHVCVFVPLNDVLFLYLCLILDFKSLGYVLKTNQHLSFNCLKLVYSNYLAQVKSLWIRHSVLSFAWFGSVVNRLTKLHQIKISLFLLLNYILDLCNALVKKLLEYNFAILWSNMFLKLENYKMIHLRFKKLLYLTLLREKNNTKQHHTCLYK